MSNDNDRDAGFIDYLQKLAGTDSRVPLAGQGQPAVPAREPDRAALAALRRGLGKDPGEAPEMFPYVIPFIGDLRGWSEKVYYLVASLFAAHPVNWPHEDHRNLGASLAWAAGEDDAGAERRFVALLNSHRDDLDDHLRHAVFLCRKAEVPIDWLGLLRQLRSWNADDRWVQRRWARDFWGKDRNGTEAGAQGS